MRDEKDERGERGDEEEDDAAVGAEARRAANAVATAAASASPLVARSEARDANAAGGEGTPTRAADFDVSRGLGRFRFFILPPPPRSFRRGSARGKARRRSRRRGILRRLGRGAGFAGRTGARTGTSSARRRVSISSPGGRVARLRDGSFGGTVSPPPRNRSRWRRLPWVCLAVTRRRRRVRRRRRLRLRRPSRRRVSSRRPRRRRRSGRRRRVDPSPRRRRRGRRPRARGFESDRRRVPGAPKQTRETDARADDATACGARWFDGAAPDVRDARGGGGGGGSGTDPTGRFVFPLGPGTRTVDSSERDPPLSVRSANDLTSVVAFALDRADVTLRAGTEWRRDAEGAADGSANDPTRVSGCEGITVGARGVSARHETFDGSNPFAWRIVSSIDDAAALDRTRGCRWRRVLAHDDDAPRRRSLRRDDCSASS